jgi:hypothetical protein
MALIKCKECSGKVSSEAEKCPHCGAPVIKEQPHESKKPGCSSRSITILIALILLWVIIFKCKDDAPPPPPPPLKPAAVKTVDKFSQMTSADHLAEGNAALQDGYKPNKDIMKTKWGRIDDAKKHLAAINSNAQEYNEAQKLLKEVNRRNAEIKKASEIIARKVSIKLREELSKRMEENLLKKGMDAEVYVSGLDKTTMRIKYVLFSRPFIYKLVNEGELLDNLEKSGFKKVIFDNKFGQTWTYTLKKEK